MPWVAAFISLLTEPLVGYYFAAKNLALQAAILHPHLSQNFMAPIMDTEDRGMYLLHINSCLSLTFE